MSRCVIVVEDEQVTRQAFAAALRQAEYEVIEASDVFACRAALQHSHPDAVVLDLGLPGVDGRILACELQQRADLGIIVVSRRSEPETRIDALDLGADDFLVKPVHLGELVARVRSVIRRKSAAGSGAARIGRCLFDLESRSAQMDGHPVEFTKGEFEILSRLLLARGKIVSRQDLLRVISRNPDQADLRSVDTLVSRIRRKIGDCSQNPGLIVTAPGFGYRLSQAAAAPA